MIQWLMNLLRGTPEEEDENPGKIIQGGPPRPIPNCKPRDTVVAQLILAEKDPNDRRLCDLSSPWKSEKYCPSCFEATTHDERMTDICLSCGSYNRNMILKSRAFRQIYYKGEWRVQRSYYNKLIIAGEEVK